MHTPAAAAVAGEHCPASSLTRPWGLLAAQEQGGMRWIPTPGPVRFASSTSLHRQRNLSQHRDPVTHLP